MCIKIQNIKNLYQNTKYQEMCIKIQNIKKCVSKYKISRNVNQNTKHQEMCIKIQNIKKCVSIPMMCVHKSIVLLRKF